MQKSKKLLRFVIATFLVIMSTVLVVSTLAISASDSLSSSVLRLHIIANSDSAEDQSLKLKVRDEIIAASNDIFAGNKSYSEVIDEIPFYLSLFEEIATQTVQNEGFLYDVSVEYTTCYFPTKDYGEFSFPAGFYDAIRVKIGENRGQNWWCVVFPPMCYTSNLSLDNLNKIAQNGGLSDKNIELIENNYTFKFKSVEWFNNVLNFLKNIGK